MNWLHKKRAPWKLLEADVKIYPSSRCPVRANMDTLKPEQLPPLMVRKAPWRRS